MCIYLENVDFGTQSANKKTISSSLKIINKGAIAGEFLINYKGNLPISFIPNQDIIPAFSHMFIRVISFFNYLKHSFLSIDIFWVSDFFLKQ